MERDLEPGRELRNNLTFPVIPPTFLPFLVKSGVVNKYERIDHYFQKFWIGTSPIAIAVLQNIPSEFSEYMKIGSFACIHSPHSQLGF